MSHPQVALTTATAPVLGRVALGRRFFGRAGTSEGVEGMRTWALGTASLAHKHQVDKMVLVVDLGVIPRIDGVPPSNEPLKLVFHREGGHSFHGSSRPDGRDADD